MSKLGLLHTLWRVLTAALVIGLAYSTTFVLIPYLDRQLPMYPVILIAYAVVAYGLIPLVIRFWRIVMKPNHIPRYAVTGDGWKSDPVNIAIVARSRRHLEKAMHQAGWYTADELTLRTGLKELYAIVANTGYARAPLSHLYLFGRRQDIGFQIPHAKNLSPRRRHHVRFWRLQESPRTDKSDHFAYWFSRLQNIFQGQHTVWIGAATNESSPIDLRWPNFQLTHGNDGDPDGERDFIIRTLRQQGFVKATHLVKDGEPFKMRSQNLGTSFVVDGYLKIVELHRPAVARFHRGR